MNDLLGIHHITAICGDAQQNVNFYTGTLGLRLVKLTVNFDDPTAYHFYYGDGIGSPGSIITFFPYPDGRPGRPGTGQVVATTFAVPAGSLDFWTRHLGESDVAVQATATGLRFSDPDGLTLELTEIHSFEGNVWANGPIPEHSAIRGIAGATFSEEGYEVTAGLLEQMGAAIESQKDGHTRFRLGPTFLDVVCQPDALAARGGRGTIHHIAFRTPDDAHQEDWHELLVDQGFNVSPVMDRQYFHSIYFREPGGILFEIATDPPGFLIDESLEELGTSLKLPPMYEAHREQIEKLVRPLVMPN